MKVTRVWADEGGESHFEDREVALKNSGPIGRLSEPIPARAVVLRDRQFIVLLDGAIEIEVSDGSRRVFRGGEILLMEDTTGRGHRTRHVEDRELRSVFILLESDGG